MKVAIIGAGYTGMAIAKKISENNIPVTIFEKSLKVGGMTNNIQIGNIITDKYYRHLFKSDKELINLAKELNIEIKWFKSKMGYYIQDKLYNWGQPLTLLKFKPLSFMQKIKFGISVLKIKTIKNWKSLEQYTIKEWYQKNKIEDIYKIIWEPLLKNKFGKYSLTISMAWLWGKINLRQSEKGLIKETLGYIDNFEIMNNALKKYLEKNKVEIKTNTEIKNIKKENNKYKINNEDTQYDIVISTISYNETKQLFKQYLNTEEKKKMDKVKYIGVKNLVIESKKAISDYYWLNMADETIPFCGIIDYHNMENIKTKDIIYISNYIEETNELYHLKKEELLEKIYPYLKKINLNFEKEDIINYEMIEEKYTQPIIETNYSNDILDNKLQEKGLYICTLPQIYPEDRGVNYAIRSGYNLANKIIEDNNAELRFSMK